MTDERRLPEGALMRSAFEEAERRLAIPDARKGVVVLAIDKQGLEVGAAFKTRRGWVIEPNLRVEVIEKKAAVRFVTRIVF